MFRWLKRLFVKPSRRTERALIMTVAVVEKLVAAVDRASGKFSELGNVVLELRASVTQLNATIADLGQVDPAVEAAADRLDASVTAVEAQLAA